MLSYRARACKGVDGEAQKERLSCNASVECGLRERGSEERGPYKGFDAEWREKGDLGLQRVGQFGKGWIRRHLELLVKRELEMRLQTKFDNWGLEERVSERMREDQKKTLICKLLGT